MLKIELLAAVAKESVADWANELGNVRLHSMRVLMRKLIRLDNPEVNRLLSEHYGITPTKQN